MKVLGTQLAGVTRRPARLLLTGLAVLVAAFVVYATVLARDIAEKTVLDGLSGTPAAVDLVLGPPDANSWVELSADQLAQVKAVPGVAEAAGRTETGGMVGDVAGGEFLSLQADPGSGPLSQVTVVKGSYPAKPGEIAVSPRTADRMGLPIGSTVTLSTEFTDDGKPTKSQKFTVTALAEGNGDFGATGYAPESTTLPLAGKNPLQRIDVRLQPGTDPAAATAALERIVDASPVREADGMSRPQVLSGADVRLAEARAAASSVDDVFLVVGMFIVVAVFAAALVAASTFRIVFAQRLRQLALLRTIGAGRGALWRALAAEGALTGLVTGVVGVLLAIVAGFALPPILRASGVDVASPGLPVLPALGVVLLAVVVTVVAVLAPAFSAARVAPLEALRAAGATQGKRSIGWLRGILGALVTLAAIIPAAYVVLNLPGRDTKDYNPEPMLLAVVASGALAFVALIVLGPLIVRPLLAAAGLPLRRFGPVGRLAVGGVGGAPRRAAAVSVVVALGVTLIAGVVVGGASARVLADRELAVVSPADFELSGQGGAEVPADLLTRARANTDLAHVTGYRRLPAVKVGSAGIELMATDLNLSTLPSLKNLDVADGSFTGLGPGKVVLSGFTADTSGVHAGDVTTLTSGGRKVRVTVAAVLPNDAPLQSSILADPADLTSLGAPAKLSGILADAAATGEDGRNAGQKAMNQLAQGHAGLGMQVLADQRDEFDDVLTAVLAIAIGLIGLTVLIAVVGVGTTVALSVVERVRESGLLRAVGLSRAGLRTMLTTESALYGVLGAVAGVLLGVPYAWLAIQALGVHAPLALPVWQLAVVFVALVLLTALAGVLPARRAAKVSPVAALATD
ncbi:FtsX family ABC transporter permease [Actinoplanes sp. N902-109]|uniref:FtsX family ABC transporter permease n=1 Tax=Actinoplanes sp. (strain N902-109) TaxID=649831 RepID=UPI00032954C4|nr:FtsX family ABC transporter permease [Actinoplanes sp. N902-109]AGL18475.1 putative ABC transporter permease protein [Actinoplanes sp. N902-109]